ncbi:hypothetical protein [Anaerocolumna sp.]|uniref:hypothetical protein n=1 Tax=Anaerocolumna sp. TaxID=2041569 RepID=UPI0028A87E01|nr:hypothetical protein [Anaerocolumna sp.]
MCFFLSKRSCTFCFYAEQTRDKILDYAVELTGIKKGKVLGNLYELDYQNHFIHVRDVSQPTVSTTLVYEHGERTRVKMNRKASSQEKSEEVEV